MKPLKQFYFSQYDNRMPEPALVKSTVMEFTWQVFAAAAITLGFWYLHWRWTDSLNFDALWFSLPVVIAETMSFIGMLLYFHNLWSVDDVPQESAPKNRSDVVIDGSTRRLSVDVFLPTYNEDPEMTRYSIRDACSLKYPYDIDINVHVLDDGNRPAMLKVAQEEGVNYLTRQTNLGYKAGNLRNGMEQTDGDFIVILDSDTRVFPSFLENTLGYFRDPDVAWVQTPQWFYDIPEGQELHEISRRKFGVFGGLIARGIEWVVGPIRVNQDPFISDPKLFYDIILRRRNRANASFCCGAGSIHRREAVMEAALRVYSGTVEGLVAQLSEGEQSNTEKRDLRRVISTELAVATELTPYKFHVSEDIYTSIILHSDPDRAWKSVLHPHVESKMLSPLDMQSWAMQRYKYAGGTLDIALWDNPLFQPGMNLSQRLMYAMTFWSYLSPIWTVIFIAAPIIALLTGIAPVSAYSWEFFGHLLPFLLVHEIATVLGTWGINNRKGKMLNLAFFSFNIQALWAVIRKKEIKFHVTPKTRNSDNFLHLVAPQIIVLILCFGAISFGVVSHIFNPNPQNLTALIVNVFWATINGYAMTVLISAACWRPDGVKMNKIDVKNRLMFRKAT